MKMPSNIKQYENKWVALDSKREKVIAHGNSLTEVDRKAEKVTKDSSEYILSHVIDSKRTYSP